MRRILFTIVSFATLSTTIGQTSGQFANNRVGSGGLSDELTKYVMGDISTAKDKLAAAYEYGLQGSAYTTEIFLPAKLFYKDTYENDIFYRYNAYNEEIEMKTSNLPDAPVRALINDKNLKIINMDGRAFSFKTFIDKKGLTQNGYLTLLSDGKYKFYKRVDVKFTEGQKAQNSFVPAQPARFAKFTEYYLEVPKKNRVDELELNNRKLIKLVADNQKIALKEYLKENNIKIKDENDIYRALDFLNK